MSWEPIYLNDRIYAFATTKLQDAKPDGAFWLQSVAAKSDQSPTLWSDANPPAFTKLYTVSTHAKVDDPVNPPAIENDGGKFMGVQAVVMTAARLADLRLARLLPRELQPTDVVFLWGRGWNALKSICTSPPSQPAISRRDRHDGFTTPAATAGQPANRRPSACLAPTTSDSNRSRGMPRSDGS